MLANLTEIVKQAALQAMSETEPAGIVFGTVETVRPLSVRLDQKTVLPESFLLLTHNVKTHQVDMTMQHTTEKSEGGDGEAAFAEHAHACSGIRNVLVHNGLVKGEHVLMLRQQGGQLYIILDRLEGTV